MTTRTVARATAALLGTALTGGCGDDAMGPPTPTTITVAPATPTLVSLRETVRLAATVRDQRGQAMADVAVAWSSGDTLVATVDRVGLVTAVAEGTVTVTARAGSATGKSAVTVKQVPDSVAVTPAADTIALGDTMRLEADAFDANGHPVTDSEISWSSGHIAVATVDASGLVTAVGAGAATISAVAGEARGSATITVENPDRSTLAVLYEAMDGPGWVDDTKWLTDAPLGEWYGVDTDPAGRVIRLDLSGRWDEEARERVSHGLTGPVPPELGDLASLEELRLASNHLSGPLPPELGRLTSLRVLNIGRNDLSGPLPPELGGLASLEKMALARNHLSGPLPTRLGELAELRTLDLADNSLSGPLPPELGGLANLEELSLGGNLLSGPIPSRLGGLADLRSLGLDRNELSGAVPAELGGLTSLARLRLNRNRLSGPIPPELGDLASLEELRLGGNRLSGPVPRTLTGLSVQSFGWDSGPGGACAPGTTEFVGWLDGVDLWNGPFCNAADRETLVDLFDATGGDGWARSGGWPDGEALEEWHGVRADSLGRVTALHLGDNQLSGALPGHIVRLAHLTGIRVDGNEGLGGRLPLSLTGLDLREFHYGGTDLCEPTDEGFRAWLEGIASRRGTGTDCAPPSDRDALAALHRDAGGGGWHDDEHWLSDEPLGRWHGVEVDPRGRVVALELESNVLSGVIPPELGGLGNLERLDLGWNELSQVPPEVVALANRLTGPIPPELGGLTGLEWLDLDGNDLTGPIPPELGGLASLVRLSLEGNALTGPIPPELGDLGNLEWLDLGRNRLTGPIPPELGDLETLERLDLGWNRLTGPIPPELGDLAEIEWLELGWNGLAGAIPSELANPADLESLILSGNGLSGALPAAFGELAGLGRIELTGNGGLAGSLPKSLTDLRLASLLAGDTELCAPADSAFQAWLRTIPRRRIASCDGGAMAYLVQAVQSRTHPVPLVAGEKALLRVFVTAKKASGEGIPPVRARFHLDGAEHVVDIPAKSTPIPTMVEEGELRKSANAEIPGRIVAPGLEMVVEIDPEGTLDPDLGVPRRIPAEGRMAVDVRKMPILDLTAVPFLWEEDADSAVLAATDGMEDDPEGHDLLEATRVLLPVGGLDVTAHDPVVSTSNSVFDLLAQTEALRVLEGGGGHYMGLMSGPVTGASGVAYTPGRSSFSIPHSWVIAHELGHNMGLWHAPCGGPDWLDPSYPDPRGRIGAWGYDFRSGRLVLPRRPDLMSYCEPLWVGDYHFGSALGHRLSDEGGSGDPTPSVPVRSLLLWGGVDAEGEPFLNPAFVAHAPPALPDSAGDHTLAGRDAAGGALFSLSFPMPVAQAEEDGGSSFAFLLPAPPGWTGRVAAITLSGPGEASATIDEDTDRPMAILIDRHTRRARAFLRGVPVPSATEAGLEVLFSRGIPDAGQWRR